LRTLVLETRPGKRVFEQESFFVISALDPLQGTTNASASRFAIEKVSPEELQTKLSAVSEHKCDLVILPGLKQIPAGFNGAVSGFVRAGGGLLLFLNDEVNPSRCNAEFGGVLPASLGHLERNASESADLKWHLEDYDLNAPMFAVFRKPGSGNLALPEFTRRFTMSAHQGAVVSATFADGMPAILSAGFGSGRVALANTSADTAWTDWPKHKTFVPWLHSLCLWLAAPSAADQMRTAAHLVTADDADIPLGPRAKDRSFRIARAGGKETPATADGEGRLQNLDFGQPGIYSITDDARQELERIAVNLPAAESDLACHTAAEFQRQLARPAQPEKASLAAGFPGSNDQQEELARLLLIAALALLFAESFLANRTYA